MRQSLSETRTLQRSAVRPAAILAVVLSVLLAVVAIADQVGGRSLIDHATTSYAPYGKQPSAGLLYGLVYAVAVVDALLWLLVTGVPRTGVAIGVAVISAGLAVLLLTMSEYGFRIFPPLWGFLALLPAVAGVAGILLRRRN